MGYTGRMTDPGTEKVRGNKGVARRRKIEKRHEAEVRQEASKRALTNREIAKTNGRQRRARPAE